ncbi:MAG: histone deacetylase family protein [Gammaproteobacteria bacterium]|nr:histone deacetylase family protein [Gammaproteobacteria bacterium]
MFKFVRVIAGADNQFERHLDGVKRLFETVFPFNLAYLDKIDAYAAGNHPAGAESVLMAATGPRGNVIGFTVTFYFADIRAAYLDYLASDPGRAARGIGGALYETMRDDMQKRGARRLFLDSLPDDPGSNVAAELLPANRKRMAFYERLGARPIMGTRYEWTVTPANLGDPNMLLCDNMGESRPLRRKRLAEVFERIMLAKVGLPADAPLVRELVDSIHDDPVALRAPRYPFPKLRELPALQAPIDLVETGGADDIPHSPFNGYYERPARVAAITRALQDLPLRRHAIEEFGLAPIRKLHDRRMVDFLEESATRLQPGQILYPEIFPMRYADRLPKSWPMRAGYFCIDTSTPITSTAYAAARRSANASLTGARLLADGRSRMCYVAGRPPGHHAERRVFGGFCYFNNAALAANHLAHKGRVAVLDIDHHHGNGTQDIFWERSDVMTVSLHCNPLDSYPFFAGFADEVGAGEGLGFNLNIPLDPGADDQVYLKALDRALKAIRRFQPQALVVSLGVDIMRGDPTGSFFITPEGMRRIGAAIGGLGLPSLIIQEGGYHLQNIRRGVRSFLAGCAVALLTEDDKGKVQH